jgi:IS30 family transposase
MTYHHLNEVERNQIQGLLQSKLSMRGIARQLGRSPSTISDEVSRNAWSGNYFGVTAQKLSEERRELALRDRALDREIPMKRIEKCLAQKLSPEEIVGRLELEGCEVPSISTVYAWIADDRESGGELYRWLRRSGKTYRHRYGSKSGTSENGIKNRISIEKRPEIVTTRSRLGDFEGDTLFGSRHRGVILTLVDRKSRKAVLEKCSSKSATVVGDAMIRGLERAGVPVNTVTLDNGKEFAEHERVTTKTGAAAYFCHPMSPHERGANENLNGLIREYLPKGMNLESITPAHLQKIEDSLNRRPRKILGYLSPNEVVDGGKILYHFAA